MFEVTDAVLIPIIVALIELAKGLGLPAKFSPVLGVVLGIAGGIFYIAPGEIAYGLIVGLMMGLSASGLYSGTKNLIGK